MTEKKITIEVEDDEKPADSEERSPTGGSPEGGDPDVDYAIAEPSTLPRPTYSPLISAVGLTFLFMWVVSSWILGVVGIGLFAVGIYLWIQDLRTEHFPDP